MLFQDYIIKAKETAIEQADNGLFYLEPLWKTILCDNSLDVKKISDVKTTWNELNDILKLEVEKRNTENSVMPYVLNWIHDIITASIEPVIMQEETDYLKNLTEYLKANKEAQTLKEEKEKNK